MTSCSSCMAVTPPMKLLSPETSVSPQPMMMDNYSDSHTVETPCLTPVPTHFVPQSSSEVGMTIVPPLPLDYYYVIPQQVYHLVSSQSDCQHAHQMITTTISEPSQGAHIQTTPHPVYHSMGATDPQLTPHVMYRSRSAPVGPDVAHASSQVEYVMAPTEYLLLPPTQYSESVSPQAVPPSPPIHPQPTIHHLNTTSPPHQHVQYSPFVQPQYVSLVTPPQHQHVQYPPHHQ